MHNTNREFRSGKISAFILDISVEYLMIGLYFKTNHALTETMSEKIMRCLEAGLLPSFYDPKKSFEDNLGPLILTLDHIGIGFICCVFPIVLASVVFLIEIVNKKIFKK